jgi:hypothetical protein
VSKGPQESMAQEAEMGEKRCLALVNGKECGLPVKPVGDKDSNVYECPAGHRSVFIPVPVDTDPPKDA